MQILNDVGLSYVKLGQSSTTLSGGEAQRIKLAYELSKRATGKTLYLLDEPTTGLHADDVNKLLKVLQRLKESGNTVIIIEHNLDMIKCADYIIDMGPEGGDRGERSLQRAPLKKLCKIQRVIPAISEKSSEITLIAFIIFFLLYDINKLNNEG